METPNETAERLEREITRLEGALAKAQREYRAACEEMGRRRDQACALKAVERAVATRS